MSASILHDGGEKPLIALTGVGKDYPVFHSGTSRLKTVFELLAGRAIDSTHRALDSIDLTIGRGESWGIIGVNGAGKSTFLKIVSGVVKPTRGTRMVNGRLSALLELGTGFHPEYSGRDNIFLASALMGWRKSETLENVERILEFADIGAHIDQPVKTYSTGMVVRLGFAVATALRPDILVTDEVLAVGDESFQKKCLRWMEDYRANGGALLLCSHSMYHVQSLCENAIWIHQGRAHMKGEAHAVTQAYLAFHEKMNQRRESHHASVIDSNLYPTMVSLWASGADGIGKDEFELGEELVLNGIYRSPDDRPTQMMIGVARIDLTPVFGAFSKDAGFVSNRIAERRFAFRVRFPACPLLPGRYILRGHTMDEYGLRMFDTQIIEVVIKGQTREHGLVRLTHQWEAGIEAPVISPGVN